MPFTAGCEQNMPIEIRELVIRATVERGSEPEARSASARRPENERQDLVAECVEQVLQILRQEHER
jgi:hypothetical protein